MPYQKINWQNGPTGGTPVNKTNLNRMDNQIAENEADIEELKSRPGGASLILTGQRRLTTSEAGKIAGLDVKGKSWQNTTIATVQGQVANTSGAINQELTANSARCSSDVIYLRKGVSISVTSGYEIYIMKSDSASGNISERYTWANPNPTTNDGYWRFMVRKTDGNNLTPSSFVLSMSPTPDHEIPIVNASGVIKAIGKNLFSGLNVTSGKYIGDDGTIGNDNPSGYTDLISVQANTAYTFSAKSGGGGRKRLHAYDANGNWIKLIGSVVAPARGNAVTLTGTTPDNAKFIRLSYSYNPSYEGGANNDTEVQIEAGATATAYEPYASNEIDLSAYDLRSAGTAADQLIVYPDKTGKLIKRSGSIDLGTLDGWTKATYHYWLGITSFDAKQIPDTVKPNALCTHYSVINNANVRNSNNTVSYSYSDKYYFGIRNDNVADADELKASLNGVIMYYELATPIETPLTAEQVAEILALETYAPETIIETELDLQSVDYLGDVKGYIDSKFEYSYTIRKIGKWADGKDFYQIIIKTTTPAAGTDGMVSNIITTNNASVKRMSGMVTSGNACSPISDYYNTATYNSIWIDGGGIKIHSSTSDYYANKPCEIIVEYTYKDGAAPAAASVMALTDDDTQTTGDEIILPEPEVYIDDTVVYGGN